MLNSYVYRANVKILHPYKVFHWKHLEKVVLSVYVHLSMFFSDSSLFFFHSHFCVDFYGVLLIKHIYLLLTKYDWITREKRTTQKNSSGVFQLNPEVVKLREWFNHFLFWKQIKLVAWSVTNYIKFNFTFFSDLFDLLLKNITEYLCKWI